MLSYLNETLGLPTEKMPWPEAQRLPLYLRTGREYCVVIIDGIKLLSIQVDLTNFSLPAFQKQMKALQSYWSGEIMLSFEALTSYQRKALIEQRVQFIVPGSQLYLPHLGIALQERMPAIRQQTVRLSGKSQLLFLYLLYQSMNESAPMSKAELSQRLGKSAMSITRAVQELSDLGLIRIEEAGRCHRVVPTCSGDALYKKAKPYLIDPVKKRVFVKLEGLPDDLPLSGESALAKRSMLNPPRITCRAIDKETYKELRDWNDIERVDPTWRAKRDFIELEIWKYDPRLLAEHGTVDVVSLAASLSERHDERVELAVEEMLEAYSW